MNTDTTMREYAQTLCALNDVMAQRPATWPAPRCVPAEAAAVRIDVGAETLALRREETRLVGILERLEDNYRECGGDVADLHWLALNYLHS